jgi:hypothetical protein
MGNRTTAPKAGALPDCATPRRAETLRFAGDLAQADSAVRGNRRQNTARTGNRSPGIVPDRPFLLHYARVLLREAKARRGQNVAWMLAGAARARREALATKPVQPDLFGDV